jgi:hypothetical protein
MSDINRRTFVTTGASLLATGASVMLWRGAEAATQEAPSHPSAKGAAMEGHHTSEEMKRCIQLCQECHASCIQMIDHCLRLGGRYATPDHLRLLMDCAQMCTTTADFMARESSFHDRTCGLCSELCRRCASSCEQVAGDDQMVKQCAELCRRCAGSCEKMAAKGTA